MPSAEQRPKSDSRRFILGFGLSGYRSFGSEIQRIGPFGRINLFIGQNNSGKSNILRFIHQKYNQLSKLAQKQHKWQLTELEKFQSQKDFTPKLSVAVSVAEKEMMEENMDSDREAVVVAWDSIRRYKPDYFRDDLAWLDFTLGSGGYTEGWDEKITEPLHFPGCNGLFAQVSHKIQGSASHEPKENMGRFLTWLLQNSPEAPRTVLIPAIREPGKSDFSDETHNGTDIIKRLARLQHPQHNRQDLKKDFRKIEHFLQEVTDRPNARLEIPDERDTINVEMDGRILPLESLGTGIHEVIILAALCTTRHQCAICIEELELHLHPLLQKKLLIYLDEQTDNQYFISTHSAHLLDHPDAAIFHVRLTDNGSLVTRVTDSHQKFTVCTDLGYRASDLLQTNAIVWVEGPSDRVYIREWIRLCAPDLVEGIHYSIMFYGGRLLSHLSPDDPEIEDFISLRRLNRNMVLVMDSDRDSARKGLNPTKRRIHDSWKDQPGFAWVTEGREIENYVEPVTILEAVTKFASKAKPTRTKTKYDRCIPVDKEGRVYADKVKIAHWLVENQKLDLNRLDLEKNIRLLCNFIENANDSMRPRLTPKS